MESVLSALRFVMMEQDPRSPHLYLDEGFGADDGDIVIDAGVAEGNFALSVIDKVSKLYLVECEEKWIEALEQTFAPYRDKVVIAKKMLGEYDEQNIKRVLSRYGFNVSTTNGYMFYRFDEDSLIDGELRRGIVRGVKQGGAGEKKLTSL